MHRVLGTIDEDLPHLTPARGGQYNGRSSIQRMPCGGRVVSQQKISFWVLLGLLVLVGWFFFHVIQPFLLPLFLAGVLALLFQPVYHSFCRQLRGWNRIAAAVTTVVILLAVILPIVMISVLAAQELWSLGRQQFEQMRGTTPEVRARVERLEELVSEQDFALVREKFLAGEPPSQVISLQNDSEAQRILIELETRHGLEEVQSAFRGFSLADLTDADRSPWLTRVLEPLRPWLSDDLLEWIKERGADALQPLASRAYAQTQRVVENVIEFVIGFVIMALGLYYFFAEGPQIVARGKELLPLDEADEDRILRDFDAVCRGVVLGTVAAALVQGVLMAFGLMMVNLLAEGSVIGAVWLLSIITVITSMIPFIGAAGVYIPVTLWLLLQGHYGLAIGLLVYGAALISTMDNVVRAYVIHGRARLHPLVALISVIGGLQAVGLFGIFLGPLVAAFFYSLLKIVHDRIVRIEKVEAGPTGPPPLIVPGSAQGAPTGGNS